MVTGHRLLRVDDDTRVLSRAEGALAAGSAVTLRVDGGAPIASG